MDQKKNRVYQCWLQSDPFTISLYTHMFSHRLKALIGILDFFIQIIVLISVPAMTTETRTSTSFLKQKGSPVTTDPYNAGSLSKVEEGLVNSKNDNGPHYLPEIDGSSSLQGQQAGLGNSS